MIGALFEIHRLKNLGLKNTQIAQDLGINRDTVSLYLKEPHRPPAARKRSSKLDPFKSLPVPSQCLCLLSEHAA